jgi:hypothetical protein
MATDYTTTGLLSKVKLWGAFPSGQPAFSDDNILIMLTDELVKNIVPYIINLRSEYFIVTQDFTITTSSSEFSIPSRALGGILREVKIVNGSGTSEVENDIPQISLEGTQYHTFGFNLQGTKLKLLDYENYTNYTLRMYYLLRPSALVATSDCAKVTSVGTTTFDVDAIPAAWVSGQTSDIVRAAPPFDLLSQSITATWAGTTVTPSTMPTGLAVGDYLCKAEETPIPKIPVEAFDMLVQATVIKGLEILNDKPGIENALGKYRDIKDNVTNILTPRVIGEVKRLNNYENFLDMNRWDNIGYW